MDHLQGAESGRNLRRDIDVADAQYIARLFGTFFGDLFYNSVQDIEPNLRSDGDIDIKDLQKIFGRDSMHCRRP